MCVQWTPRAQSSAKLWETVRNLHQTCPTQGAGKMGIYSSLLLMARYSGGDELPQHFWQAPPSVRNQRKPSVRSHRCSQSEADNSLHWCRAKGNGQATHCPVYYCSIQRYEEKYTSILYWSVTQKCRDLSFPLVRTCSVQFAGVVFWNESPPYPYATEKDVARKEEDWLGYWAVYDRRSLFW